MFKVGDLPFAIKSGAARRRLCFTSKPWASKRGPFPPLAVEMSIRRNRPFLEPARPKPPTHVGRTWAKEIHAPCRGQNGLQFQLDIRFCQQAGVLRDLPATFARNADPRSMHLTQTSSRLFLFFFGVPFKIKTQANYPRSSDISLVSGLECWPCSKYKYLNRLP